MDTSRPSPKYQQIADDLLDKIESGELPSGARLPTEAELGRQYDVSRITVVHAIRILQNRNLVYRVRGSGTFVARRGAGALSSRAQSAGSMPFISAVFPQGEESGAHKILVGIESECARNEINVTIHDSRNRPALEHDILMNMLERGCVGGIVYPCFHPYSVDAFSELLVRGFPFVLIDRRINYLRVPLVACDNERSMREMVGLAIGRMHRAIGFFCNGLEVVSSEEERFRGYCDAHIAAGLNVKQELMYSIARDYREIGEGYDWSEQQTLQAAEAALSHFLSLEERPTCVVAVNDHLAIALMKAAFGRGLKVPRDLAITGFDDLHAAAHLGVPLTTVRQPFQRIGVEAARLLIARILGNAGPSPDVLIPGEIIERESLA